ncbi:hypothetical protein CNMCM8927_008469 [Aspergillus lentulus]|uniref:Dienelactone hydrolase domain-containing protein n=1 Tax=Aspergillus lentulus TaxID=293939 RepID=A0AAN5YMC3_ASPLE|nr:hypothetical protein CNMCM8060_008616 [Aspergillus lentulus]KAF4193290.1 hypothetical protein CNMCM8694_008991 [Aspergillus lentulus]KAF4203706.1 hypothetical protein CNMCM8927_008469 [Aspergillus lentulus]
MTWEILHIRCLSTIHEEYHPHNPTFDLTYDFDGPFNKPPTSVVDLTSYRSEFTTGEITEFLAFANWAFGPHGLQKLELLVFGQVNTTHWVQALERYIFLTRNTDVAKRMRYPYRQVEALALGHDYEAQETHKLFTFGSIWQNTRLLADHYVEEVVATVDVPDLFGGEILPLDILQDRSHWHKLNLPSFMQRNSKPIREPQIIGCAKALRSLHRRTGAIGFCYGGWAVFRLGAKGNNLVDCISTAHPSLLEKSEIETVAVPVQILAPKLDPMFTEELKLFSNQHILKQGVPYDYQYFPGIEHGFASRGDPKSHLNEREWRE